jgi:hypothetical protein
LISLSWIIASLLAVQIARLTRISSAGSCLRTPADLVFPHGFGKPGTGCAGLAIMASAIQQRSAMTIQEVLAYE